MPPPAFPYASLPGSTGGPSLGFRGVGAKGTGGRFPPLEAVGRCLNSSASLLDDRTMDNGKTTAPTPIVAGGAATDPSSERLRVADVMTPLPARLALHHSVAAARELMFAAGFSFLVVVAPTTGKLLGIVLRRALEKGCELRGHDPEACPLVRHVETDIDFCLEGEYLAEVFGSSATSIDAGIDGLRSGEARRRRATPVIVVDDNKVPVGLLSRRLAVQN